jgi:hypothetical protein
LLKNIVITLTNCLSTYSDLEAILEGCTSSNLTGFPFRRIIKVYIIQENNDDMPATDLKDSVVNAGCMAEIRQLLQSTTE